MPQGYSIAGPVHEENLAIYDVEGLTGPRKDQTFGRDS